MTLLRQKGHFFGKNEGDQRVSRQKLHIYGKKFKKKFSENFFSFFSFFLNFFSKNEKKMKIFFSEIFF